MSSNPSAPVASELLRSVYDKHMVLPARAYREYLEGIIDAPIKTWEIAK